jgi:septal ring factor EnvC (AmiA/AmiB activator)
MAERMRDAARSAEASHNALSIDLAAVREELAAEMVWSLYDTLMYAGPTVCLPHRYVSQEASRAAQRAAKAAAQAHANDIEHRDAQTAELTGQLQRSQAACDALEAEVASLRQDLVDASRRADSLRRELESAQASSQLSTAQLAEQATLWRTRFEECNARAG